ncbi:signal peptidase II [Mycoplasma sp. T363T]|uniref:signal peptidase II n=1 Tax=Mycoplasma bradburyae TaxID=2963128 RepID=UPI0020CC1B99|nr:signal peptidase II [Mycoplasma bradburyae]MDC4163525.1 signal peptidase II [Mycoplasma bradburyae]UTS71032.1 signal peptidase II [Mycoplasma bradburyae]
MYAFKRFLDKSKDVIIKQFKIANTKKLVKIKYPILFGVGIVILLIVFLLRNYFLNLGIGYKTEEGFININVITNKGVGFSLFNSNPAIPYLLQILLTTVFLITFVFCKNIALIAFLPLIAFGGLSNVIDRSIPIKLSNTAIENNSVLDYFQFFKSSAIFNFADICIVIGFVLIFLNFFIELFVDFKNKNKNNSTNKQIHGWKNIPEDERVKWSTWNDNKCVFCNQQMLIKDKQVICSNQNCSYIDLINEAKPLSVENQEICIICNNEMIKKSSDKISSFLACSRFNEGCYYTKNNKTLENND